jgi:hypothetical protein
MVADAIVKHPAVNHYLRYVATTGMSLPPDIQCPGLVILGTPSALVDS